MGTTLFDYRLMYTGTDATEGPRMRREIMRAISGLAYVRSYGASPFEVVAVIRFTETGARSLQTFEQWVRETLLEGSDSFLYEPFTADYRDQEGEFLGVSTGAVGERFSLNRRFVNESSLVVKVNGTPDTNFTLEGNNDTPEVVTTTGFAAGNVTADYRARYQVVFKNDILHAIQRIRALNLQTPGLQRVRIELVEQKAGSSRVA